MNPASSQQDPAAFHVHTIDAADFGEVIDRVWGSILIRLSGRCHVVFALRPINDSKPLSAQAWITLASGFLYSFLHSQSFASQPESLRHLQDPELF